MPVFKKGLSFHSGGRSFKGEITDDQAKMMEKMLKTSKSSKTMADYIVMPKKPEPEVKKSKQSG